MSILDMSFQVYMEGCFYDGITVSSERSQNVKHVFYKENFVYEPNIEFVSVDWLEISCGESHEDINDIFLLYNRVYGMIKGIIFLNTTRIENRDLVIYKNTLSSEKTEFLINSKNICINVGVLCEDYESDVLSRILNNDTIASAKKFHGNVMMPEIDLNEIQNASYLFSFDDMESIIGDLTDLIKLKIKHYVHINIHKKTIREYLLVNEYITEDTNAQELEKTTLCILNIIYESLQDKMF